MRTMPQLLAKRLFEGGRCAETPGPRGWGAEVGHSAPKCPTFVGEGPLWRSQARAFSPDEWTTFVNLAAKSALQ
jgi:hypothetical protein